MKSWGDTAEDDGPIVPGSKPLKNTSTRRVIRGPEGFDISELKSTTWNIGGQPRQFYTVGELAKALGREPVTIRSWEHKGWMPPPKFRTPKPRGVQLPDKAMKGRRLYTQEQVLYLVSAVRDFGLVEPKTADWGGFHLRMLEYPQD